jgi:hypothetical protein
MRADWAGIYNGPKPWFRVLLLGFVMFDFPFYTTDDFSFVSV